MNAEQETLSRITDQTFRRLREVFEAIPDDKLDWSPAKDAMSPRMQVLHACGADRGYANRIDKGARRTSFDRDRELGTKEELKAHLEATREMTLELIRSLSPEAMDEAVEIPWMPDATARFVLLHMLRHRHYHVGQLNLIGWILADGEALT